MSDKSQVHHKTQQNNPTVMVYLADWLQRKIEDKSTEN